MGNIFWLPVSGTRILCAAYWLEGAMKEIWVNSSNLMREIAEGAHAEYDDERKHRDIRFAYHGHPYYKICEHWMIVQADNVIAVGIGSRRKTRQQAARIAFALAYALHHKNSCSDNSFQQALTNHISKTHEGNLRNHTKMKYLQKIKFNSRKL